MESDFEKHNPDNLRNRILNDLNNDEIVDAMVQIKTENFQKLTHNVYVAVCILIIFISLFFLTHSRFLFSTLIVLGITLLHFKICILEMIYEMIDIHENKKKQVN